MTTVATIDIATPNLFLCKGIWTLHYLDQLEAKLHTTPSEITTIIFDGEQIQAMDTAGAWLLYRTKQQLEQQGKTITLQHFAPNHLELLTMMAEHDVEHEPIPLPPQPNLLAKIGKSTCLQCSLAYDFLAFIGESAIGFLHVLASPKRIRWQALWSNIYQTGFTALPIVGLMSFLIGLVLAYQGGSQLSQYGANIFIVELVGITLLRELAPMMTAVIVAGRSGSAYTAQIGTMKVTEEIDALRTLGITPMELLVLPKLFALIIVLPLLTVFADVMAVLGGIVIANLVLDIQVYEFLDRFPQSVGLEHYLIGIGKAPIFAAIIALVGCYQGFQVSGSADSVGKHVTNSVVQAIFLVIIADAVFSIIFSWLGL